jgi:hypothetical protein
MGREEAHQRKREASSDTRTERHLNTKPSEVRPSPAKASASEHIGRRETLVLMYTAPVYTVLMGGGTV